MISDFKIYVPVLNEELLITHTVDSLLSVFPGNVEVINLGCTDSTIARIVNKVKVHNEPVPDDNTKGRYYTQLKNEYSARQSWVLWVDGDEIYPTCTLHKIRDIVEHDGNGIVSHRLYWRILREFDGKMHFSKEFLSAGPKLFNSKYQTFVRDWPREVSNYIDDKYKAADKCHFNELWFWHGVLLKRSHQVEPTYRRKKRQLKEVIYNDALEWVPFECLPWENNFKSEHIEDDWRVFDTGPGAKPKLWTGK